MKKSNKFSPEVRERAVRLVQEHRGEYPSLWATVESIAPKMGCVPSTLLDWVKQAEVDSGPDGHFKFPHLWPVKLPRAGRANYGSTAALSAMREAASLRR